MIAFELNGVRCHKVPEILAQFRAAVQIKFKTCLLPHPEKVMEDSQALGIVHAADCAAQIRQDVDQMPLYLAQPVTSIIDARFLG